VSTARPLLLSLPTCLPFFSRAALLLSVVRTGPALLYSIRAVAFCGSTVPAARPAPALSAQLAPSLLSSTSSQRVSVAEKAVYPGSQFCLSPWVQTPRTSSALSPGERLALGSQLCGDGGHHAATWPSVAAGRRKAWWNGVSGEHRAGRSSRACWVLAPRGPCSAGLAALQLCGPFKPAGVLWSPVRPCAGVAVLCGCVRPPGFGIRKFALLLLFPLLAETAVLCN
jgi:hypothetical protein